MLELSKETQVAICELRIKDYMAQLSDLKSRRATEKKNMINYTKEQKTTLTSDYRRKYQYLMNNINFNKKYIEKLKSEKN